MSLCLRLALVLALLHLAACRHQLIVVSCDGFRYDYLDWYPAETQFLRQLIPKGVHVNRMTTAFTTKTFPNHWTIATGLYQESHGIVSNKMYDPVFNDTFDMSNRQERWWNASLPIWIAAKQQGLKSATFFWPGSEVQFQGIRPNHYFEYNESISFDFRVETVLRWVTQEGINMVALYFNEPDSSGHKYGPNSTEVATALRMVDATIKSLMEGLEQRGFSDKVNVLIVSDHGMMALQSAKVINLTNTLDDYAARVIDTGALLSVNAKPGKKQQLIDYLNARVANENLSMRVFAKEDLPVKYHYSNNRRIPDVLVLPDQGYLVVTNMDKPPSMGTHGFDNQYYDMKVPMFAVGPSFRKGVVLESFRQVDIYGLMCRLLEIRPQPNNGSTDLFPLILKDVSQCRAVWFVQVWLPLLCKLATQLLH